MHLDVTPQVEVAHSSGAAGEALCRRAKELDAQAVIMARCTHMLVMVRGARCIAAQRA